MNKENTLKQLKILLGIADDTKDTLLMRIIDECIDRVVNYCRRDDFPDGLVSLLPIMAHRAYISGGYGRAEPTGAVTSIKQGDRTVSYEGIASANGDWMDDFISRLEPYRRRKGRLPSECI